MIEEIKLWPQKIQDGFDIANNYYYEHSGALPKNINKIAFFGMGGSGIAGRIVKTFLDKKSSVPSFVIDGPEVPNYIDTQTLAIVVSYSGNTWETIEAFQTLLKKHIPILVISNNGKLLELSESNNIPFMLAPNSKTPRSALGSFLGIMLGTLGLMNLAPGKQIIKEALDYFKMYLPKLEDPSYYTEFITMAKDYDSFHILGVCGDSDSFAYRSQTQFNENSKVRAVFSSFPEMNHNLIVGFTANKIKPLVLVFSSEFISPNLELSLESLLEVLNEQGVNLYKPMVLGDNWCKQLFHIVLWSDFASYFLAKAKGVDVEPVLLIDSLKSRFNLKQT